MRRAGAPSTLIFAARRALFSCLMARHFFWKSLSSAYWRSPVSRFRSLGQASVPKVSVMSAARPRVAPGQPPPRRHAVGLVLELVRRQLEEVLQAPNPLVSHSNRDARQPKTLAFTF